VKLCELKIKDSAGVTDITQALLRNGYSLKVSTKFKEYPRETSIDYFSIEVFDHPTEKGGAE
jgi:hypothetical protein